VKKVKEELFIHWKYPISGFNFQAEIRPFLTNLRPCFSMFAIAFKGEDFIYSWYLLDIVFSFQGNRIINHLAVLTISNKVSH